MNICAIRIDERLIHGQVATLWQGSWRCNRIMVIDEVSSKDPLLKSVLKISCPPGIKLSVIDSLKAATNLKAEKYGNERITIVVKTPQPLVDLIEYGFDFTTEITVGNMSNGKDKKRVSKNICVNDTDVKNFYLLNELGKKIISQMVPSDVPTEFMRMLNEALK